MTLLLPDSEAAVNNLTPSEIDAVLLQLQSILPESLTDEQLTIICCIHRKAARTTSGPPKAKASRESHAVKTADIDDIDLG